MTDVPRRPRKTRRRWVVPAMISTAALVIGIGAVGVVIALQPSDPVDAATSTPAPTDPAAEPDVAETPEAEPEFELVITESLGGGLVGGETMALSGTGLSQVATVMVAGQPVDATITETTIEFTMPRSERYVAGPVEVAFMSGTGETLATAPYEYRVETPVDAQMEYAFRHWQDYNLADWGTFNPSGGDCMNFVSQTLFARGWQMTDNWYSYDGGTRFTSAWVYVPTFDNWLRTEAPNGVEYVPFEQRDRLKVGDIVVFDFNNNGTPDHIQIVSAVEVVDGETKIKMVGHNRDSDYRDLDETLTVDHPGGVGWFYSVPTV